MAVGEMPRIDFNLIISRGQTSGSVQKFKALRDCVSSEIWPKMHFKYMLKSGVFGM